MADVGASDAYALAQSAARRRALHGERRQATQAAASDELLALAQPGQVDAARAAYLQAIGLEIDPAVRRFLQRRATLMPPPT